MSQYERGLTRELNAYGVEPYPASETHRISAANVIAFGISDGNDSKSRYKVWLAESLLYGFRCLDRGDVAQAFRAYGQACQYLGHCNGFGNVTISDALSELRSQLEGRLR